MPPASCWPRRSPTPRKPFRPPSASNSPPRQRHAERLVGHADKAGKERFKRAESAKPGDVIEYRAELRNVSRATLKDQALTLPVPPGTAYVPSSARPAQAQARADGGKFEAMPLMRVGRNAQGQEEKIAVPPEAYRALRWPVTDLPAGSSFKATARVRVTDTPAEAAKD